MRVFLGECLYKQNNYLGAFQVFKKTIESYPASNKIPYGMYYMGRCLRAMNMVKSAIKVLHDGIQSYPTDVYAAKMALRLRDVILIRKTIGLHIMHLVTLYKSIPMMSS